MSRDRAGDALDVLTTGEDTSEADAARRRFRLLATRRSRIVAGVAATAVVLASGTGAVYAAAQTDDSSYRTANAETADVSETLAVSGQLSSSSSTDAAFQVAGTVDAVLVGLGDEVEAGQELATLDTSSLEEAVTQAEDAVASAEQTLEDDLDAQSSGSSDDTSDESTGASSTPSGSGSSAGDSATGSTGSSGSAGSTGGTGGDASQADDAATQKAMAAVTAAQDDLMAQYDLAVAAGETSSAALTQAEEVCAPFLAASLIDEEDLDGDTDGDDPADAETSSTGASDETDAGDAEGDGTEGGDTGDGDSTDSDGTGESGDASDALQSALEEVQGQLTDCQSAISDSAQAQDETQTANEALTAAASTLDESVTALAKVLGSSTGSSGSTGSTAGDQASQPSGTTDSTTGTTADSTTDTAASASGADDASSASAGASGGSGGMSTESATVTAERILADRAAVDAAEADLAIAQQNLTFASITSPIAGTVVSVGMAEGDSVSAASDTAVITVQGEAGYVISATVSLSKIDKVEVGQTAAVSLPAFGADYSAEVTSIGVLNVSETSTPSYTVTLSLDTGDEQPRIAATANATIDVSDAVGVLTVPTSAVTRSGTSATVVRLKDGKTETVQVTLGATGSERTEIVDGLDEGDVVVLADLNQAITSDDEETAETGLSGLGGSSGDSGSFPGGEFPGGSGGDFPSPPGN